MAEGQREGIPAFRIPDTGRLVIAEGENFIVEGDVGDSIYLLLKGNVRINQALTLSMHKGGLDNREKAIINFLCRIDVFSKCIGNFSHLS